MAKLNHRNHFLEQAKELRKDKRISKVVVKKEYISIYTRGLNLRDGNQTIETYLGKLRIDVRFTRKLDFKGAIRVYNLDNSKYHSHQARNIAHMVMITPFIHHGSTTMDLWFRNACYHQYSKKLRYHYAERDLVAFANGLIKYCCAVDNHYMQHLGAPWFNSQEVKMLPQETPKPKKKKSKKQLQEALG